MSDDWNPNDYLVSFPDSYYEGPWVNAPLVHKTRKVGDYLFSVLKASQRCLTVDAEIPALIATLAAVDYIAGFHAGRESKRADFIAFMDRYFADAYKPFLDQIYGDMRCGLVHNLVAVNPWRPSKGSFLLVTYVPNHLSIEADRIVWSIGTFIEHTYRAWVMYSHHLVMGPNNEAAIQKFHARFDRLAGIAAWMDKVPDGQAITRKE